MSTTHLSHALLGLLTRRAISAKQLADETGLTQSTISRACSSRHQRLDVPSLRALCTSQPDPRDSLEILLAHLRDEVERAGRTIAEVAISATGRTPDDDIAVLAAEMRDGNEELIALIRDMAQLARAIRRREYPERAEGRALRAADDPPTAGA